MPRAILSVHDKTGLVDFARGLHELGWTLIASGGTARALRDNAIPATEVADYTGSPEILGGRVKTLHPAIHGGLLARSTEADHAELLKLGWDYIDLVAVNLYPFEATIAKPDVTFDEVIENIDIGGVTLIRAAAKNHQRVTLVCDPADYSAVLNQLQAGGVSEATRKHLAIKGFASTAHYDTAIFSYLNGGKALHLTAYPVQTLRYGENPHQSATLYSYDPNGGPLGGNVLQGKELSYNNLLDLDAAWKGAVSFDRTVDRHRETSVTVRHGHGRSAGGRLSGCPCFRSDLGLRRRHRQQSTVRWRHRRRVRRSLRRMHRGSSLHRRSESDSGEAQELPSRRNARSQDRSRL